MFSTVTHCARTRKESACRIIHILCQQISPKCWFANANMTSYYDVTNSAYPLAMTTPCHCSIPEFGRGHTIKKSPGAPSDLHWSLVTNLQWFDQRHCS